MTNERQKDFETLEQAARRLLAKMDERQKLKAPGSLQWPEKFTGGAGILAIAPKRESGRYVPQIPTPSLARRAWIGCNDNSRIYVVHDQ
jgi:hypothetical protein